MTLGLINKNHVVTKYKLQSGIWLYANCEFSFRSSMSCRTGNRPQSTLHIASNVMHNNNCAYER